jgi:hypothetical protein
MNPHAGSNLRNFGMNRESSVEIVAVMIIIGYKQSNSINVKNAKPGQH